MYNYERRFREQVRDIAEKVHVGDVSVVRCETRPVRQSDSEIAGINYPSDARVFTVVFIPKRRTEGQR